MTKGKKVESAEKRGKKERIILYHLASLARSANGFPVFWPVSQASVKESGKAEFMAKLSRDVS